MDATLAKLYEQEAIELGIRMDVMLDRLAEIVGMMAESGPLPYEAARPISDRLACTRANILAATNYILANTESYQQVKITDADEGVLL